MSGTARKSTWRELRQLLRLSGFRKLFAVRLVSQMSDGMFQVGLATLLFFSPEAMGTATGVATGFAVMLAPFSLVGPFAGALLDRWSRRQILFLGNLIRAIVTALMGIAYLYADGLGLVHVLGLVALSINRFLLAGLSAGLPKLIADDYPSATFPIANLLLTANSLVPTLGAGAAFLGGAIGLGISTIAGPWGNSAVLFTAALTMSVAALLTLRLALRQLGPETPGKDSLRDAFVKVAKDLLGAARYLKNRLTPGQALLATAIHRFLYGLVFIAAILMSRNMGHFALIMGLIGAGGAFAVVLTPLLSRKLGSQRWVGIMFVVAAAAMAILSLNSLPILVFISALVLGVGSQGSKIAVDTIVQRDTIDQFRGRAFAFYDVIFNAAFVASAVLAAVIIPDSGWSRPLFIGIGLGYLLTAYWMFFLSAKQPA